MENTKIYQVVSTFNTSELKALEKWLPKEIGSSSNEFKLIVSLINSVKKEQIPRREVTYASIFGKLESNDILLRRLSSKAFKVVEHYMIYTEIENDESIKNRLLLNAFRRKKLNRFFERQEKIFRKELDNSLLKDSNTNLIRYQLESEVSKYLDEQQDRSKEPNLQQLMDALDQFYLGTKLKLQCMMENHASVSTHEYQIENLELVKQLVKSEESLKIPQIKTYSSILEMISTPGDRGKFAAALHSVNTYSINFTVKEARDLYLYASNMCIKQIVAGDESWLKELMSIYEQMLNRGLLLEEGVMSPWTFKNIAAAGIRLEKYDWVEHFISEYGNKLTQHYRENGINYNKAYLLFARKKYREVISSLQIVEYQDLYYALDVRALLMKTYFNLKECDSLLALCESFRLYVLRHPELTKSRKQNFNNLIRIIRGATKARNSKNIKVIKGFLAELEGDIVVSDKAWLKKALENTFLEISG